MSCLILKDCFCRVFLYQVECVGGNTTSLPPFEPMSMSTLKSGTQSCASLAAGGEACSRIARLDLTNMSGESLKKLLQASYSYIDFGDHLVPRYLIYILYTYIEVYIEDPNCL